MACRRVGVSQCTRTWRRGLPFFCYIHRTTGGVPHFEVLAEVSPDAAAARAARLLTERRDGERAELWQGDTLILILPREAIAA
jgi:hypothetical protein